MGEGRGAEGRPPCGVQAAHGRRGPVRKLGPGPGLGPVAVGWHPTGRRFKLVRRSPPGCFHAARHEQARREGRGARGRTQGRGVRWGGSETRGVGGGGEPAGLPKHAHDPSARHVPRLEHGAADPPSHSRLQSAPRNPL